jgi:hypothetical protein
VTNSSFLPPHVEYFPEFTAFQLIINHGREAVGNIPGLWIFLTHLSFVLINIRWVPWNHNVTSKETVMSDEITGTSEKPWKDVLKVSIETAARSAKDLRKS